MKIYLTSAYPLNEKKNFAVNWLRESADNDPYKIHSIADDPKKADIILFVEHHPGNDPYFFKVLKSSIFRKHKDKCYLYHDCDWAIPIIPGIYPSLEQRIFHPSISEPGPYIARLCENEAIKYLHNKPKTKYLFSFMGARITHPVRTKILELKHPNGYLKDTSGKNSWKLDSHEKCSFEEAYVNVCQKSKFILCPRGVGPSTYRLFESMEMGIAPVIISDDWIPIKGPEWDSFSIRIPEKNVNEIPVILETRKADSEKMGIIARKNWEKYFSKEVCFHHMAESCNNLHKYKNRADSLLWIKIHIQFLRPFHLRNFLRYLKKSFLNNFRLFAEN